MTISRTTTCHSTSQRPARDAVRTLIFRCWWATLVALHIAPLCATLIEIFRGDATLERIANALTLLAAIAFFGLKFLGVPVLPMRSWSSVIAFLLICAVAHAEVRPSRKAQEFMAELPAAVAATVVVEAVRRSTVPVARLLRHLRDLYTPRFVQVRCGALALQPFALASRGRTSAHNARAPPR